MTEDEILARLLYRDGLILVLNKPAGLAVHRGPKGGETLEDSLHFLTFGLPRNPALAHRLDKDTSGCLILGRHRKALEKMMLLFKRGEVNKTYWAVIIGGPLEADGLIDLPLAPQNPDRGWWMKVDASGAPSQTRWRVLGRGVENGTTLTWLQLEPLTGRTHQLRVHCAHMGWPILGDNIYGVNGQLEREMMHLHARDVTFSLSKNKPALTVVAPPPAHMLAHLTLCGWQPPAVDPVAEPLLSP